MKTRPEQIGWTMAPLLVLLSLLLVQSGCASVGTANSDRRAWGRPADLEEKDEQRRTMWWGWPFGNSPAVENQQAEEWLISH